QNKQPEENVLVSLVCRSNYEVISKGGVELITRNFGDYRFLPHKVFPSIESASLSKPKDSKVAATSSSSSGDQGGWDYVVVTTKALPDLTNDAKDISNLITRGRRGSCIVLIQNGVGVEEPHRLEFPENPIVSAVTVISAEQIRQGVVKQNRWTRISMGCFTDGGFNRLSSPSSPKTDVGLSDREISELRKVGDSKVNELVEFFRNGGVKDAEFYQEVPLQLVRWHKICINGSMNPSSVLSGGTGNSRMSLDPELRIHLKGVMEEIFKAIPLLFPGQSFDETKLASPERILKSTERNTEGKPSMLLDWENGRRMELEVILGNPVRIARSAGVELPRLQTLYSLLKMAQTRRQEDREKERVERSSKL
ncbi:6-phosphogluconate dehydrogenase C-terminal domain-like protein, partial [Violaceomyces palustris]